MTNDLVPVGQGGSVEPAGSNGYYGPSGPIGSTPPPVSAGGAPAEYAAFKVPESAPKGATFDAEQMKPVVALFRKAGLSQEMAQEFLDFAVAREMATARRGSQFYADMQTKWVSEIKADPEIGGDKLQATIASAALAIDRFGGQGLKDALNLTGAGNNPHIVRAFARMGRMLGAWGRA